jgi:hypothetical protein
MHAYESLPSSETYSEFFRACLKLTDRPGLRAEPDHREQLAGYRTRIGPISGERPSSTHFL